MADPAVPWCDPTVVITKSEVMISKYVNHHTESVGPAIPPEDVDVFVQILGMYRGKCDLNEGGVWFAPRTPLLEPGIHEPEDVWVEKLYLRMPSVQHEFRFINAVGYYNELALTAGTYGWTKANTSSTREAAFAWQMAFTQMAKYVLLVRWGFYEAVVKHGAEFAKAMPTSVEQSQAKAVVPVP